MNSCYGKTIQKPIEYNKVFKHEGKDYDKYIWNHFYCLIDDTEIGNKLHCIKVRKPINKHMNFSILGIHVLAMSKRIMNEVMCLAEDLNLHIYYQDTDSIHIFKDEIPILEEAFKEKYGRVLRGKQLGQFHPDFDEIDKEIPVAIESYFIGKKLYLDHLINSKGTEGWHVRGKGLTQLSIKKAAEKYGGYLNLYKKLYEGEEITFDLADGAPSFQHNKDFSITSRKEFLRKVQSSLPFGVQSESGEI